MTGLDEIEKQSRAREIDADALLISKEVQEQAYEEAYALGLTHGKKEAYEEEKQKISEELSQLQSILQEISNLKLDLFAKNKKHIVSLCSYFAKRLLMKEIEASEDYILSVIMKAIEMAHSEEDLTIKISQKDFDFLQSRGKELLQQLSLDESVKIEFDEMVSPGGAIIETNYGVVDATIEQRVLKLEEFLEDEST